MGIYKKIEIKQDNPTDGVHVLLDGEEVKGVKDLQLHIDVNRIPEITATIMGYSVGTLLFPDRGLKIDHALTDKKERIAQAAQVLMDFIDECPGGNSYIKTEEGYMLSILTADVYQGLEELKSYGDGTWKE